MPSEKGLVVNGIRWACVAASALALAASVAGVTRAVGESRGVRACVKVTFAAPPGVGVRVDGRRVVCRTGRGWVYGLHPACVYTVRYSDGRVIEGFRPPAGGGVVP